MTATPVTRKDVLRRTAVYAAVSICSSVVLSLAMAHMLFGNNPDASVPVGFVTISVVGMGVICSSLLGGGLSYRSAVLLQKLSQVRAELLRLSCTDQLTGLLNRRGYDEAATLALTKAHEAKMPAVALMCDIDHFKAINDQFGHEFGDRVLVEIGQVLRSFAEQHDMLVARHGGEEFAALMIGISTEQAVQHANALRRACAATEVASQGVSAYVTVSIGVASSQVEMNLSQIMRSADQALYIAKHGGRNRVARAEALMDSIAA